MTIKSATIGSETITDEDLGLAMSQLSSDFGLSRAEVHQLVVQRGFDRTDMNAWVVALAAVHDELRNGTSAGKSYLSREIDAYVSKYPPYDASGARLALTAAAGNAEGCDERHQSISDADAASEVARIAMQHDNPRMRFDVVGAVNDTTRNSSVQLSRTQGERLYDDSSELQLTASEPVESVLARLSGTREGRRAGLASGRAATTPPAVESVDANVARLSTTREGARAFGLSQGGVPSVDDVNDPVESDLSGRASYDPTPRLCEAGHLVTDDDADFCGKCGALVTEDTESGLNNPATLGDVVSELGDVNKEIDRLSAVAKDVSGNAGYPPKSVATRNSEEARARDGHPFDPIRY